MVNVEIDARILEDKKFNTQVENIITETREARRNVQIGGAQLKSSPVIRLMDELPRCRKQIYNGRQWHLIQPNVGGHPVIK